MLQTAFCAEGGHGRVWWTSFHWLFCSLLTLSRKHSPDACRTHKITFNSAFRVLFCFSIQKNLTWWNGIPLWELYIWVHRYDKVVCSDSPRRAVLPAWAMWDLQHYFHKMEQGSSFNQTMIMFNPRGHLVKDLWAFWPWFTDWLILTLTLLSLEGNEKTIHWFTWV